MHPPTIRPPPRASAGPSVWPLALIGLVSLMLLAAAVVAGRAIRIERGAGDAVRIEALTTVSAPPVASGTGGAAPGVPSATPLPLLSATDPTLETVVRDAVEGRTEHYSVVVKELTTGSGAVLNPDRVFYAASLYKLAVLYAAFRQAEAGQLDLTTELPVTAAALAENLGTLEKVPLAVGDRLTVRRLLELMIIFSDNTAATLLRDALGRPAIDDTLHSLGLRATSVATPELPTTAADMALLAEAIATGRGVSEAASREMTAMLREQSVRGRIPAGLPAGVPVANKTGTWEDAGHDVAIVSASSGTYILAVLSDLTVRDDIIADLSRRVYAYYTGRGR